MTVIKDGTGQGFLAGVNNANQLLTRSINITEIAYASELGNAFQTDGETTIASGTEKTVIVMVNNAEQNIEMERTFLSIKNQSGVITTVKTYLGTANVESGGSSKTPKNLNSSSLNTVNVTVLENNPTITSGSDVKIQEQYFQLQDTQTNEYTGGIVLGKNGSVRVTCTGGSGAVGTFTCDASLLFFLEIWTIIHNNKYIEI